jgi:outer membrane protein
MKKKLPLKLPILFIAILLSAFQFCLAQNQRILNLDEAINLGLLHSKQLILDSINIDIVKSKISQNRSFSLPQISANASYIRISDNITPFQVAFPAGNVVLNPQILNQSYNSIQAKQLIWAGGKIKYANELLNFDKEAIAFDSEKNKSEVSYSISSLWYNLYSVKQSKKIVLANLSLLRDQQKDAVNFVKQGIILENEVLKIDLAITNLETDLSDLKNTTAQLKFNLAVLTGLDFNKEIDISETLPESAQAENNLNPYLQKALINRAELKGLSLRKEQANTSLKLAKTDYLPTFSAGGSYNYDQPNQRLFPNQAVFTGTWNAGVFLNWNISSLYINKDKIKESKLGLSKINTVFEQAEEGIKIEVNTDFNNYLQTKEKIRFAQKAIEQATENFRVEENKFRLNTTTSTDYLAANTQLLQAKLNLVSAQANSELAYRKLLKSTNQK